MLLRVLTEWLPFLRCVDTCESDPVLLVIPVEQGDRVPIGNAHDPALKEVG